MNFVCVECGVEKKEDEYPSKQSKKKTGCCKACIQQHRKKYESTKEGFKMTMLEGARKTAKKRLAKQRIACGVMTLTFDHLNELEKKQEGKCALSGIQMVWRRGTPYQASIDRICCAEGYTIENVRLVCWIVNNSLSDFAECDFVNMCNHVAANNYLKNNCI
jgi:hypothetical protein